MEEEINYNVITTYLSLTPALINKFNLVIEEYIQSPVEMKSTSKKYLEAKNKFKKEKDIKKQSELKKIMTKESEKNKKA